MSHSSQATPQQINAATLSFPVALLLVALLALHFVAPGNVPWINDAPKLFTRALDFNARGVWANIGLVGSLKLPYGAPPTWFYQSLLSMTVDLQLMVVIKVLVTWSLILGGLWSLCKRCNLHPLSFTPVLVSPYLYYYGRHLWDNCFLIPLSVAVLASYAWFVSKPTIRSLAILSISCSLFLQIHLMSAFLLLPLAAFILFFEAPWILKRPQHFLWGMLPGTLLAAPYLKQVFAASMKRSVFRNGLVDSAYNSVAGANYASFGAFFEYYDPAFLEVNPYTSTLVTVTQVAAFLLLAHGLLLIASLTFTQISDNQRTLWDLSPKTKVLLLAVSALVTCTGCYLYSGLVHHAHYHNAVAACFFLIQAVSLHRIISRSKGRVVFGSYLTLMLFLLVSWILHLEHTGGNRGFTFGPHMKHQIAVVKTVAEYPVGTPVDFDTKNYQKYSRAFTTLLKLEQLSKENAAPSKQLPEGQRLRIGYETGANNAQLQVKVH